MVIGLDLVRRVPAAVPSCAVQIPIVGISWYDGAEGNADPLAPTLAIAFENGRVQVRVGLGWGDHPHCMCHSDNPGDSNRDPPTPSWPFVDNMIVLPTPPNHG